MNLMARALRTRWFVRAPIPMFRHGLGFVFGDRLLLLEHVGRRSGEARYVVLEVVQRESPTAVVVASGFGAGSQWFRNLQATPECHVTLGRTRHRAEAVVLATDERDRVLADYARDNPGAWKQLSTAMAELNHTAPGEPLDIPLVRFELQ